MRSRPQAMQPLFDLSAYIQEDQIIGLPVPVKLV